MVESAQADADAEIGFAAEELDQRDRQFARGDWIFAGLEIHVGDGWRQVVEKEFGEFVEFSAVTIQIAIGTAHSAVMAVFAAEIGEFDDGADENGVAKMGACSRGGAFVEGGLFAVARQ